MRLFHKPISDFQPLQDRRSKGISKFLVLRRDSFEKPYGSVHGFFSRGFMIGNQARDHDDNLSGQGGLVGDGTAWRISHVRSWDYAVRPQACFFPYRDKLIDASLIIEIPPGFCARNYVRQAISSLSNPVGHEASETRHLCVKEKQHRSFI